MAKSARKLGTVTLLSFFLMTVSILCLATLCFSLQQKNSALSAEVQRLTESQILLMVPEEQAKPIVDWLASHPTETQSLLEQVYPNATHLELPTVGKAVEAADIPPKTLALSQQSTTSAGVEPMEALASMSQTFAKPQTASQQVILAGEDNGIKVIVLPHGGIRVTTREEE